MGFKWNETEASNRETYNSRNSRNRDRSRDPQVGSFLLSLPPVREYANQVEEEGEVYRDELLDAVDDAIAFMKDNRNTAERIVKKLTRDIVLADIAEKTSETADLKKLARELYDYLGSRDLTEDLDDVIEDQEKVDLLVNIMRSLEESQIEDILGLVKANLPSDYAPRSRRSPRSSRRSDRSSRSRR